jgi:hypothetical protein
MATRSSSMATIDEALLEKPKVVETEAIKPNVSDPHAAPGVDPVPSGDDTEGEKIQPGDEEDEEEKSARQKLIDEALQQREIEQKKREDAFYRSANATVNAAQSIVKGAAVRIESVPTPGSVMLPLIVLIVFFVMLLPVNGHTRFVWLWLTVTGNADIVNGASGDFTGGGGPSVDTSTPVDTSLPLLSTLAGVTTGTFAEEPA